MRFRLSSSASSSFGYMWHFIAFQINVRASFPSHNYAPKVFIFVVLRKFVFFALVSVALVNTGRTVIPWMLALFHINTNLQRNMMSRKPPDILPTLGSCIRISSYRFLVESHHLFYGPVPSCSLIIFGLSVLYLLSLPLF